jgi:hypothetical protein
LNKRISLFILIVLALSLFWSSPKPVNALTWWNTDWNYKMKLTIDHTKVGADLTDFPVLVYLNSSRINWSHVRDNLKDIRFIDSTETTELFAELENYTVNDKAWMWVKISSVSHTVDTNFYIYYGNNEILPAMPYWSPNNVWEDSAVMVQHMADNPDNAHIMDSTQYDNNGAKMGANEPIETASGKIDSAQSFDGDDDYISIPATSSLDVTKITVSVWVKPVDMEPNNHVIINKRYNTAWELNQYGATIYISAVIGGTSYSPLHTCIVFEADTWVCLAWTWDGSKSTIYKNGIEVANHTDVSGDLGIDAVQALGIGCRLPWVNLFFNGTIDEPRIYNEAKSAEWVLADYYSGSDSLLMYGAETLVPLSLTIRYNIGINKLYINNTQIANNTTIYIDQNTTVNATAISQSNYIFYRHILGLSSVSLIPMYLFNMTQPFTLWSYATPNFYIYEEPTTFTFSQWMILLFVALGISLLAAIKFHIIATVSFILVIYMVINVASFTGMILLAIIVWLLTIMFSIIAFAEI